MIRHGIDAARRAPSAHNTQPWEPRIIDETTVVVSVDPARRLPVADPHDEDLWLGLGCWVEAFAIGAGRDVDVSVDKELTVRVREEVYPGPYTAADLHHRQVDRGRLDPDPAAVAAVLAAFPDVHVMPEKVWRRLAPGAGLHLASSRELFTETLRWVRLDPADPRYRQDGLSAECLRMPRGAARILHRLLPLVVGTRAWWRHPARWLAHLPRPQGAPPTRLVLAGCPETAADLVELGRRLLRVWLALDAAGLRVSVHSEFKDHPPAARALRELVNAKPCAVFAAGRSRSATVPWSARREARR